MSEDQERQQCELLVRNAFSDSWAAPASSAIVELLLKARAYAKASCAYELGGQHARLYMEMEQRHQHLEQRHQNFVLAVRSFFEAEAGSDAEGDAEILIGELLLREPHG